MNKTKVFQKPAKTTRMTFRLAETDKEILSQYASQIHMSLAEFSRNLIAIGFQEYTLEQEALNNEIHYENK